MFTLYTSKSLQVFISFIFYLFYFSGYWRKGLRGDTFKICVKVGLRKDIQKCINFSITYMKKQQQTGKEVLF